MGAVIIPLIGLYLFLLVWATRRGWRWAVERGWQGRKRWLGAAYGFLIVCLPVFWDWIPTVVAHHYYCSTEAGFWVYKTPEQWEKENPGVMETLVANRGAPSETQGDMVNYTDIYFLNQRFNWVVKRNGRFLLNRWRHEQEVVDAKTNEVLARYVDFSTSQERPQAGWSGWKFWLANEHCVHGGSNQDALRNFRNEFIGAKK